MRYGAILVFVWDMKRHVLSKETLWDLAAEILTELSERDSVQYRIRATEQSVAEKLEQVNTHG